MRDLTKEERNVILAKYPEAKAIAVNNFLGTVGANDTEHNANMNLNMDARLYRWNPQTVKAIAEGIKLAARSSVADAIGKEPSRNPHWRG